MAGSTSLHPCNTGLSLGLGSCIDAAVNTNKDKQSTAPIVPLKFDQVLPSLSLGPSDQGSSSYSNNNKNNTTSDQDEEEEEASPRKKLRLTKDQSAILEDIFKEHITLNPNQKQALAKQLNLRRRQVEVWFQNKRARTKLKQTEMDCEVLKKSCERLSEENKRLQKELLELRSLKLGQVYMQVGPASVCPSCDGGATSRGSGPTVVTRMRKQRFSSPV